VLNGETHLGKTQEDEAKDGAGVFLRLEARVGAELVGGVPQALFERCAGAVFFWVDDPLHGYWFFRLPVNAQDIPGSYWKIDIV